MLKRIFLGLSFFIFLALTIPNTVSACTNININPEFGTQETVFTVIATGCPESPNGYSVIVSGPSAQNQAMSFNQNVNGYSVLIGNLAPGAYTFQIQSRTDETKSAIRSLTIASEISNENTYGCSQLGPNCVINNSSTLCDTGFSAGLACASTPLSECSSVRHRCIPFDTLGQEGQPCRSDGTCSEGLTCSASRGNICVSGGTSTPGTLTCREGAGIETAIGCISFASPNEFVAFFLRWGIGIGGGVAFLLIVYGGFTIMTSTGNPDRLKAGQAVLTSAIAGLIMIIFSIFILRLIGVNILKIPGLIG